MHPYNENFYYYFVNEAAYTCAIVRKYLTPEMSIMQFNTLIRFRKLETAEYFSIPIMRKQGLLPHFCATNYFLIRNYDMLRRAYTMKFFFHDLEIFISKEKCQNISGSEICVVKCYSVCSHNQVSFIRS